MMPQYTISAYMRCIGSCTVEAESAKEAVKKFAEGDSDVKPCWSDYEMFDDQPVTATDEETGKEYEIEV
tara:strand:- start:273 stop:479 length:207 start_codon:yes stop_codon:yes gene_type:complete